MQLCSKSNCNMGSEKNPEELSGRDAEGSGRGCSSVLMGDQREAFTSLEETFRLGNWRALVLKTTVVLQQNHFSESM